MYALISAAVLAADLAVHPNGGAIADLLDRSLSLTELELSQLSSAVGRTPRRDSDWNAVEVACGVRPVVPQGVDRRSGGRAAAQPAAETDLLRRASDRDRFLTGLYGGLPELTECLREDILGWSRNRVGDVVVQRDPLGVRAVSDAVGAAYAAPGLPAGVVGRLSASWREVIGDGPQVAALDGYGPRSQPVRAVIDGLARADRASLVALREHHHQHAAGAPAASDPRDWAECMHVAAQTAFLHDRIRQVASAQLALARAARLAQVPAELASDGVLTAATGAVQAVALSDVLPLDVLELLTEGWTTVFGTP